MSIENSMEKLTASIEALTGMIASLKLQTMERSPAAVPQPASQPKPSATPPVQLQPQAQAQAQPQPVAALPALSAEETNARLVAVAQKMGDAGVGIQGLLRDTFKVGGLKELDPSRYLELVNLAEGLANAK